MLDLVEEVGARAIDEALRRRVVRIGDLHEALAATAHRRGNKVRARLLADSADEPWSEAERAFHRILRAAKLPHRWVANYSVRLLGEHFYVDAALPAIRLAFEIDGFEYHCGRGRFEHDRHRDVTLARHGWQVVRFSASQVLSDPDDVLAAVRDVCRRTTSRQRAA